MARPFYGCVVEEQEVVRRIQYFRRDRGRKRLTYQEIADRLNGEGISTRDGKKWRASTIWLVFKRAGSLNHESRISSRRA